jgi:radical SAM superfamily enzyme YgiQ (UPF0313 family)
MEICLINPPIEDFYSTGIRRQPLGLLYIASSLVQYGYKVILINGHTPAKKILPIPKEFEYLKPYINRQYNPFPFKNYYRFGASSEHIENQVSILKADVFFIQSHFTPYYRESANIMKLIRSTHPSSVIVTGGYHASLYPEYFLKNGLADYVITGEGEQASIELLAALEKGDNTSLISNLSRISSGKIMQSPNELIHNLDDLPFPARNLLPLRDFRAYRKRIVSMISSRGCPHRCKFCSTGAFWGNTHRTRSVQNVIAEIDHCVSEYGLGIINFEDDNIFPERKRALRLLSALSDYRKHNRNSLEFLAMNGISLETVDDEIICHMKRAGFSEINLSIATISEEIQRRLARPFDTNRFSAVAGAAKSLGMKLRSYFIMGLPGQDRKEIEATIEYLKSLGTDAYPSLYYDVNADESEWFMQRSSAFYHERPGLSREDQIDLFHKCITAR